MRKQSAALTVILVATVWLMGVTIRSHFVTGVYGEITAEQSSGPYSMDIVTQNVFIAHELTGTWLADTLC